jgi:HPt (histidine-containing phosphotransfer) domain-containing protein
MDTIVDVFASRAPARRTPPWAAARPPKGARRLRVLVAEDNAVNQRVAVGMLERVGGDRKALAELVRVFRADWPRQLARLREALRQNDAVALRAAAHALKGAVSNFAARAATEAALGLQKMGEAGRLGGAGAELERLEREVETLGAALAAVVRPARPGPPRDPRRTSAGRQRPRSRTAARRGRR